VDPLGFTSNLLRGSTVFTGLIVLTIVFITMMGFTSSGVGPRERRPPILLIVIVAGVGLVAVAAFLFPHLANQVIGGLDRIRAR
jgi:hypothetical protein